MSQDYAKKKKTKSVTSSNKGLPVWFWLFSGVAIGLFIAFLIYLSSLKFSGQSSDAAAQKGEPELTRHIQEQAERMREGQETLKKPTFEFYEKLPEMTVDSPRPVKKTSIQTTTTKSYLLQAGSFPSFKDADSLKAQLIMQGLDVQIQTVKDQQGKSWHRVQVGPYSTQNSLNKAQDVLAKNNIPSILLEAK